MPPPAALHTKEGESLRSALALMAGVAVSAAGVGVAVGSAYDLAGVLFIGAGALVAVLGVRHAGESRSA